jgi:hypothetical protein
MSGNRTSDGVLDLNTRVNFNEVMPSHLIDQELCSSSIPVPDALREPDRVRQNGLTHFFGQVSCRGNLNNLLVTSLDGAVTLEQVNRVTDAIGKNLDFDMTGALKETLYKDSTISECRFRLGYGTFEGVFEVGLLANNTHATAATSHGSLNNDYMSREWRQDGNVNGTMSTDLENRTL